MHPQDLQYTKTHEWIKIEGNVLTIGITAHAVKELMGINHVCINEVVAGAEYKPGLELRTPTEEDLQDSEVKKGVKFLQGKTVTEIDASKGFVCVYSPVRGKVIEMNSQVNEKIKSGSDKGHLLIEKDSYKEGWIAKIEISDISSLIPLMTAEEYEKYLLEGENPEWESGDF